MYGTLIGDIVGSRWEFRSIKTTQFALFGADNGVTDDSVMTVAVADALLNDRDPAATLRAWARRVPIAAHLGGYGAKFGAWLAAPTAQPPYGSYGNGGAMRVAPAGGLATSLEQCLAMAARVTAITHDHPEGLKGALATAHAIWLARQHQPPPDIRAAITAAYGYDLSRDVGALRATHRYNETAPGCVPAALTCALEAGDFEAAIRNAVSLGGDADTLAAIAGGLAEALYGIPAALGRAAWPYVPDALREVLAAYYAARQAPSPWEPL